MSTLATLLAQPFAEWAAKMTSILGGFDESSPLKVGTERDPAAGPLTGLLVSYELPEEVLHELEAVSDAVCNVLPGTMHYGPHELHATIAARVVNEEGDAPPEHHYDFAGIREAWRKEALLAAQAVVVCLGQRWIRGGLDDIRLRYDRLHANQRGVVAGLSNPSGLEEAYLLRCDLLRYINAGSCDVVGAWGLHSTLNRFTSDAYAEECAVLAPIIGAGIDTGWFRPTAINVSAMSADGETFRRVDLVRIAL